MKHAWLLLLVGVLLWVFWRTYAVWFAGFLAIAFTVVLQGVATGWSKRADCRYGWALAMVLTVLGVVVGVTALWIGPALWGQWDELSRELPKAAESAETWLGERGWGEALLAQARKIDDQLANGQVLSRLTSYFSLTMAVLGGSLAVLAMTLFLSATPKVYERGAMAMVPPAHEDRAKEWLNKVATALRWWVVGRLISMAIVGVFTGIGLWIVGVPLPFVLGLIAGLLSFVPNLGPILSLIPGVLLAGTVGAATMLWAVAVYVGVQLVESNLVTPMVQRYAVSVPPALLLLVQLAMGFSVRGAGVDRGDAGDGGGDRDDPVAVRAGPSGEGRGGAGAARAGVRGR